MGSNTVTDDDLAKISTKVRMPLSASTQTSTYTFIFYY